MASVYTNYYHNGRFRLDYSAFCKSSDKATVSWSVTFEYTGSGWIKTQGIQLWMNGNHLINQANDSSSNVQRYNNSSCGSGTYDISINSSGQGTVSWNLQGNVYHYPDNRNCKTNNGADASATVTVSIPAQPLT